MFGVCLLCSVLCVSVLLLNVFVVCVCGVFDVCFLLLVLFLVCVLVV